MPPLVRLHLMAVAAGFVPAGAFVGLLLALDAGGPGRLVTGSAAGWLGGAPMVAADGIVVAGAQVGIRVMGMAEEKAGGRSGGGGPRAVAPGRSRRGLPRPPGSSDAPGPSP